MVVSFSPHPTANGHIFLARNTGLQTLTMNHLGPHPTEESVLFAGTQDNGESALPAKKPGSTLHRVMQAMLSFTG